MLLLLGWIHGNVKLYEQRLYNNTINNHFSLVRLLENKCISLSRYNLVQSMVVSSKTEQMPFIRAYLLNHV